MALALLLVALALALALGKMLLFSRLSGSNKKVKLYFGWTHSLFYVLSASIV